MSDIFLSYKSENKAQAQIIAEALERKGISVWWDRIIPPGRTFDEVIEEELDAAKCVIVLWSQESVKSKWVRTEASEGNRRGILIPILIDDTTPPLAFRLMEAAKLPEWDGTSNPEFDLLLETISKILGRPLSSKKMARHKEPAKEQMEDQITKLFSQFTQAEKRKDWDKVIILGEQILESYADHEPTRSKTASAYDLRGVNYIKKGDLSKAIPDLNHAIELDPTKQVYYHSRGTCYQMKGEYDKAIADYNSAIELDPNEAYYYYSRGISYHEKGEFDKSITDKTRAIELDPNQADYYEQRGLSYYKKGDPSRAIADLNRAIELDSNNAERYYIRGMAYKLKGDKNAAKPDLQRATELGHENAEKRLAEM